MSTTRALTSRRKKPRGIYARKKQRQDYPRTVGLAGPEPERKYFTTGLGTTALAAANTWAGDELDPAALCLFSPVEGADINNRIGRKVCIKKIAIRGVIEALYRTGVAAMTAGSIARLILYMDKQSNGAQSQAEDLMAAPSVADTDNCLCSYQNTASFGRFKVLVDRSFNLSNGSAVYNGATRDLCGYAMNFKMSRKFVKPLIVRFNGTNGGTIADIVDNSFHIIGCCSNTGCVPSLTYECRTVFTDS